MLSSSTNILRFKPRSAAGHQVAQLITDIDAIELDAIEPAVRALGGYLPDEKLDDRCLHLIALLRILFCASRMELPLQSVDGVRTDAGELLEKIDHDLA